MYHRYNGVDKVSLIRSPWIANGIVVVLTGGLQSLQAHKVAPIATGQALFHKLGWKRKAPTERQGPSNYKLLLKAKQFALTPLS